MKTTNELQFNVVFQEAEEGGYTVIVPELPGCISEGDTFEKAKVNIIDAISLYLEDLTPSERRELVDQPSNTILTKIEVETALG